MMEANDEKMAADQVRRAVDQLNEALMEAARWNLEIKMDWVPLHSVEHGECRMYSVEVLRRV